jgi:hypothetical protein
MSTNAMISFRPKNMIRQLPWQLDSKAALGFILILATFSLVGWLYLSQASAVTATSYRIDELRFELDRVDKENAVLTLEIAQLEALPRIEARARELGFEPTTNVRYLPVDSYPMPAETRSRNSDVFIQASYELQPYSAEIDAAPWWIRTLDSVAEWVEGR